MQDLFTLDENGNLILDKEYLRGIPEFKAILERDKGSKGDVDGRKKYRAWKEFFYIYMVASIFSYPNKGGYNPTDTHIAAVRESGLEDNYKPDADIRNAIAKYKEIHKDILVALGAVTVNIQGLKLSKEISQGIIENIQEMLEIQKNRKEEKKALGEPIDLIAELATTQSLVGYLDQLVKIGNKLPDTIETLESLQDRLKKESSGAILSRGGQEIGNRAEPKSR